MRRILWLARAWTVLALLLFAGSAPSTASAQVVIPQEAIVNRVDDVIRQGELLERERRWGDAQAYYEDAIKNHPNRDELRQRLDVARTHLDVARRLADQSYLVSLEHLTQQEALDLYSEVLLKVDTYHVNEPNWKHLVYRGVVNLDIAMTEPAFADHFPRPVSIDAAPGYVQEVQSVVNFNAIQNRSQAVEAAAVAARVAARQLGVSPQAAILEFTCAAASSLDQYSAYLTGNQLDEVFSQIEGNFVGLGIELKAEDHSLLIVHVIPGGPAAEAGMLANERIVEVDGQATTAMSSDVAADMLKGPELSYVEIVLQAPNGTLRTVRVQRRRVDVPSVQDVKMVDPENGVGLPQVD